MFVCVLGNPWPPVMPHHRDNRGNLLNVLLEEARKEYMQEKFQNYAQGVATSTPPSEKDLSDEMDGLNIKETGAEIPKDGTPV